VGSKSEDGVLGHEKWTGLYLHFMAVVQHSIAWCLGAWRYPSGIALRKGAFSVLISVLAIFCSCIHV